jgi:hypothetical protein
LSQWREKWQCFDGVVWRYWWRIATQRGSAVTALQPKREFSFIGVQVLLPQTAGRTRQFPPLTKG